MFSLLSKRERWYQMGLRLTHVNLFWYLFGLVWFDKKTIAPCKPLGRFKRVVTVLAPHLSQPAVRRRSPAARPGRQHHPHRHYEAGRKLGHRQRDGKLCRVPPSTWLRRRGRSDHRRLPDRVQHPGAQQGEPTRPPLARNLSAPQRHLHPRRFQGVRELPCRRRRDPTLFRQHPTRFAPRNHRLGRLQPTAGN